VPKVASGQATTASFAEQTTKHAHLAAGKKERKKETAKQRSGQSDFFVSMFNKLSVGGLGLEPAGGMLCAIHLQWHFLKVA